MKTLHFFLAILLCLGLCLSLFPIAAFTDYEFMDGLAPVEWEEDAANSEQLNSCYSATTNAEIIKAEEATADFVTDTASNQFCISDDLLAKGDLFAGYVESVAKQQISGTTATTLTGERLTGINNAIYWALTDYILQVASGERASTVFVIPVDELGLEQLFWTADELNVDSIISDDAISDAALTAVSEKGSYDLAIIIRALLADNPYALYWYDKTKNTESTGYTVRAFFDDDRGEYVIGFEGSISFSFPVAAEYSAGEYVFDTEIGTAVQSTTDNACAIVQCYAEATDYEKLKGYMQEICQMVSYNQQALDENTAYGNPWQVIWVFDDNPSTNVVCEGYAKAFQFLCDLTEFSDDISCIMATGIMSGGTGSGEHMWNIVNMENGINYLVDLTNCDTGTIGADDQLFLAGYSSGDMSSGYTFSCRDGDVLYCYDENTLCDYQEELIISDSKYVPDGYEYSENGIDYTIYKDHAAVTGYSGSNADVVIPQSVQGVNVTVIGCSAFYQANWITSVSIPSTVKTIKDGELFVENWEYTQQGAFAMCTSLRNIVFDKESELETIGKWAFYGCTSLETVTLPKKVKYLNESCFENCKNLVAIDLPDSLLEIWDNALHQTSLRTLTLPPQIRTLYPSFIATLERIEMPVCNDVFRAEDGILYIYDSKCWYTGTTPGWVVWWYPWNKTDSVYTVPDFVGIFAATTALNGRYSHVDPEDNYSDMQYVPRRYPEVIDIGNHKLNCPVMMDAYVQCSDDNPYHTIIDGVLYDKAVSTLLYVPKNKEDTFLIPDTVSRIEQYAARYSRIRSIVIPNSVAEIGDDAFSECPELLDITFPDSVTEWGLRACAECPSLQNVVLPRNLVKLNGAVLGCTSLTEITIPKGVQVIETYEFARCGILNCVLPETVRRIDREAFINCNNMRSIYLPKALEFIGENALAATRNLSDIYYEGSEEDWAKIQIEAHANNTFTGRAAIHFHAVYYDCTLPSALKTIETEAMAGCAFRAIRIPNGVRMIGTQAFAGSPNLKYVYIPESVTEIAADAFYQVSGLTILGKAGSAAETYAQQYGFSFIAS